jgi:hypothetical protein
MGRRLRLRPKILEARLGIFIPGRIKNLELLAIRCNLCHCIT